MLRIYNTLTKQKEKFKPISDNKVGMYVCGVTVYDLCHIGHARTFLSFDIVSRYLRYLGYELTFVRNITDIDDKIINRASENGESCKSLTQRLISEMHNDFDKLNINRPDIEPHATQYIKEIINFIRKLIKRGFGYIGNNGDVLFDVSKCHHTINYGKLSNQNLKKLRIDITIDTQKTKRNPLDFVLWKMSKPGEPAWNAPWGMGRPGWHIECSAMNSAILGKHFDIHGGGSDLKFPHHENEIAQSCCANDTQYVNTWMHTGMMMINQEKMSKSLGNFFTIRELLQQYNPETLRYFLTSGHYRKKLNYTKESLKQANSSLKRLYTSLLDLNMDIPISTKDEKYYATRFINAMDDDFNTPIAYSILFDMAHHINQLKTNNIYKASALGNLMLKLANIIGILYQKPETFLKGKKKNINKNQLSEIETLIKHRNDLRALKDWVNADIARNKLEQMGIILEDTKTGTNWRRK
ncbi:cysteine--tRNA ligase [Candidatus Photodesmus anomalopis]|uniref:Cysteine--tRNA ligase n=1 Tax=Candidatus Photodesmus katoptron Akat1 TaxID=1236703 RepID=S3DG70_9GAMM|nr:cysteine--tRNA ligase [Candidatus Photodesmus katoptron]EPE37417.1 cysteinyl-tRNA synthetase [Candidatus Photodesmus katoptron Akat1]